MCWTDGDLSLTSRRHQAGLYIPLQHITISDNASTINGICLRRHCCRFNSQPAATAGSGVKWQSKRQATKLFPHFLLFLKVVNASLSLCENVQNLLCICNIKTVKTWWTRVSVCVLLQQRPQRASFRGQREWGGRMVLTGYVTHDLLVLHHRHCWRKKKGFYFLMWQLPVFWKQKTIWKG